MKDATPFYKKIPWRNFTLDLTQEPIPQSNGKEWSIDNMRINDYDLFICDGGCALFEVDGETFRLEKGMGLLIGPNKSIYARAVSEKPVKMVAQHFMLYLFGHTDFFSLISYRSCISFKRWDLIRKLSYEIVGIYLADRNHWSPVDTGALFSVILNAFIDEAYLKKNSDDERKSSLVLNMIHHIEQNYADPGLLEKLMEESAFGYSHTANTFKKYTGLSVKSFITERRLNASKGILLNGGTVRAAAEAGGYEDEFYFSRIFKRYNGVSPREFKNRI